MNKKIFWIIGGLAALIVAYYLVSPIFIVKEADEILPAANLENIEPVVSAEFIPSAHEVEGRAAIYEINGQKTLRFEDFETINGPDLFIYLATDTAAEDFVNLGEIKATKGNVNYDIPPDTDLEKYDTVLVWCRAFRALFSYAELKK
jgi:hypothetical protein